MTNCLFYSVFFSMFLTLSLGSLKFSQINRSFLSIYKGMLEACVLTINDSGEPVKPYYNEAKVNEYVISYLEKNISRYSKNFTLTTSYYDENFIKPSTQYSRGISINLKAKINFFTTYDKEQRFSITSKEEL